MDELLPGNMVSDRLKERLRKSVRFLGEVEPRTELQMAILESLLDGAKTVAELTREILDEDSDYQARYMRVKRAIRSLEAKGYISTRLLGRPKPYRLTPHAREQIACLASGSPVAEKAVELRDLVLFSSTMAVASAVAFGGIDSLWVYFLFVYLTGLSTCRIARVIRRVS